MSRYPGISLAANQACMVILGNDVHTLSFTPEGFVPVYGHQSSSTATKDSPVLEPAYSPFNKQLYQSLEPGSPEKESNAPLGPISQVRIRVVAPFQNSKSEGYPMIGWTDVRSGRITLLILYEQDSEAQSFCAGFFSCSPYEMDWNRMDEAAKSFMPVMEKGQSSVEPSSVIAGSTVVEETLEPMRSDGSPSSKEQISDFQDVSSETSPHSLQEPCAIKRIGSVYGLQLDNGRALIECQAMPAPHAKIRFKWNGIPINDWLDAPGVSLHEGFPIIRNLDRFDLNIGQRDWR